MRVLGCILHPLLGSKFSLEKTHKKAATGTTMKVEQLRIIIVIFLADVGF